MSAQEIGAPQRASPVIGMRQLTTDEVKLFVAMGLYEPEHSLRGRRVGSSEHPEFITLTAADMQRWIDGTFSPIWRSLLPMWGDDEWEFFVEVEDEQEVPNT